MANPKAGPPNEPPELGDDATAYGYPIRVCRICRDDVIPRFRWVPTGLYKYIYSPTVQWVDYDGENARPRRLFRPCRCIGGLRFIHDCCLEDWRNLPSNVGGTNYFRCYICGYEYRKARMLWGNFIKGKAIQLSIVALIMIGLICAMGFFASPVINQWLEPGELEKLIGSDSLSQVKALTGTPAEQDLAESSSLVLHFIKGFASLGVLGFLRAIMWLSPFPWFNLRAGALAGGRQRRVRNSTTFQFYLVLVAGWFAILQPTYVFVRDWTQERLEMLSDKIIDVQGYDNPYEGSYD